MKSSFLILHLVFLFILTSCASMDLEKCQSTNWEDIAQNDVSMRYANYYDVYLKQCREFGVIPDKKLYDQGFRKGLEEFCTFQNGYLIGNDGHQLPRICPKESQDKFVQGFIQGQSNHDTKKQMEKQNELIEKAIDINTQNKGNSCDYNYQCGRDHYCQDGKCHHY